MKTQGSNDKVPGISELLASPCSASAPLDRSWMSWNLRKVRGAVISWHRLAAANNKT